MTRIDSGQANERNCPNNCSAAGAEGAHQFVLGLQLCQNNLFLRRCWGEGAEGAQLNYLVLEPGLPGYPRIEWCRCR